MTIVEFLLARIAEDAMGARFIAYGGASGGWGSQRIFAECRAKREIILRYQNSHAAYTDNPRDEFASITSAALFWAVVDLAAVYADHPDYRDEWRPA